MYKNNDIDVCKNDCILFHGPHAAADRCPVCTEKRYQPGGIGPVRSFTWLPLSSQLEALCRRDAWTAQLSPATVPPRTTVLTCFRDSPAFRETVEQHQLGPEDLVICFSTDGVNPVKGETYSLWPLLFKILERGTRGCLANPLHALRRTRTWAS